MHIWGDENVDWAGIDAAAEYIGLGLRRWGRIQVTQYKSKYGTCRVYCSFGVEAFYWFVYPGYVYYRWPKWVARIDRGPFFRALWRLLNRILIPYQMWIYRLFYRRAIARWPHLQKEITSVMDYPELLEDKDG